MEQQNPMGQVSPDGMWQWDGAHWQPTEKQMHGGIPDSGGPDSVSDRPARLIGGQRVDKRAAKAAAKEEEAARKEAVRQAAATEKEREEFAKSPVGRARAAFDRGDEVFQYSIDVMAQ